MKTWVVANQKGGVGKTTTAICLAGLLAEQGKRVLIVDLDPHASVTHYFNYDPDTLDYNLFTCFVAEKLDKNIVQQSIIENITKNLALLPASLALATLDRSFGTRKGMGLRLKIILENLSVDYDFVIIDCPPLLGVLMINALAACEYLIIPVQTEFLAIKGLERMLQTVTMVYKKTSGCPPMVVIPTMFDRRTKASVDSLLYLRNHFPGPIWRSVIPIDTQFRDASQAHLVPSSHQSNSHGVAAYRQLLSDIINGTINQHKTVLEAV